MSLCLTFKEFPCRVSVSVFSILASKYSTQFQMRSELGLGLLDVKWIHRCFLKEKAEMWETLLGLFLVQENFKGCSMDA